MWARQALYKCALRANEWKRAREGSFIVKTEGLLGRDQETEDLATVEGGPLGVGMSYQDEHQRAGSWAGQSPAYRLKGEGAGSRGHPQPARLS